MVADSNDDMNMLHKLMVMDMFGDCSKTLAPVQQSQGAQDWSRTNDHMEANLLANMRQSMMTWPVGILFCEMPPTPGQTLVARNCVS